MFKSRRTKAIDRLKTRKAYIEKIANIQAFERWKVRTNAIVKQYVGENEFHRQKFGDLDLSIAPNPNSPDNNKNNWLSAQKILAKEYITSCIHYLENDGKMVLEPNILAKLSNELVWSIYGGSIVIAFGVGVWWADSPFNSKNYPKEKIEEPTNKEPSVVVPAPIVPLKENTTKPTNVEGEKD
jgi:hypothetical protein